MILYHGSNVIVKEPIILQPNRFLDFGPGFYTTTNLEQAKVFAGKVLARKKDGESIVSVYELDETALGEIRVLSFDAANERWLDFVSANRNGNVTDLKYDLISGPVADDDIFRTFILYSNGLLTKEQTLEALKVKKLFNQYVFSSRKALSFLHFLGTEKGE